MNPFITMAIALLPLSPIAVDSVAASSARTSEAAPSSESGDLRNEPLELRFEIRPRERSSPITLRMTWAPAESGKFANQTRVYDSREPSQVFGGTRVVPPLRKEILEFTRVLSTWPKTLPKPKADCREEVGFAIIQGKEKREWDLCMDPEITEPRSARVRGWIDFIDQAIQKQKTD